MGNVTSFEIMPTVQLAVSFFPEEGNGQLDVT
jgi:hypothetical protein